MGVSAGAKTDKPGVGNGDANGTRADRVATSGSPVGEVDVKAQDF